QPARTTPALEGRDLDTTWRRGSARPAGWPTAAAWPSFAGGGQIHQLFVDADPLEALLFGERGQERDARVGGDVGIHPIQPQSRTDRKRGAQRVQGRWMLRSGASPHCPARVQEATAPALGRCSETAPRRSAQRG